MKLNALTVALSVLACTALMPMQASAQMKTGGGMTPPGNPGGGGGILGEGSGIGYFWGVLSTGPQKDDPKNPPKAKAEEACRTVPLTFSNYGIPDPGNTMVSIAYSGAQHINSNTWPNVNGYWINYWTVECHGRIAS